MRSILLRFLNELRAAGLSISVSEGMDALRAAAAIGLERALLREALAASLVKTQEDRPLFDDTFTQFFARPGPSTKGKKHDNPGGDQGQLPQPGRTSLSRLEHRLVSSPGEQSVRFPSDKTFLNRSNLSNLYWRDGERQSQSGDNTARQGKESRDYRQEQESSSIAYLAQHKALMKKPFQAFDGHDVEASTVLLEELSRRLRARLSRRSTRQKHGRLDFRRTIRSSLSQGGVPINLKLRKRRPVKPNLLALCDLSGSVAVVSDSLLALLAPATAYFHQVRTFAYVDRLCEVSFEHGHIVPDHGMLDLYARSDFGKVLQHFWQALGEQILTRNTIVLVLGDARNNRRPPRPDLLARIGDRVKTLLWLNPEPQHRWDKGDSVMSKYTPCCDAGFACNNLQDLLKVLQQTL